jgi:hypothetical protein
MMNISGNPYEQLSTWWRNPHRRKDYVRLDYNKSFKEEAGAFVVYVHTEPVARVYADNTVEPLVDQPDSTSMSAINCLVGAHSLFSDKSNNRLKQQTWRVKDKAIPWRASIPYTRGVKYRQGYIVNPEICIDYVRTIDKDIQKIVHAKSRQLSKVLRVVAKLDVEFDPQTKHYRMPELDFSKDIDGELATQMLQCQMRMSWDSWGYTHRMSEAEKAEFRQRKAKQVLSKYTAAAYEQLGAYYYAPVNQPAPLLKAA